MSSQYEGNPDNYPDDYTIPDDADPATAAAFNVAAEALGDRTAWLKAHVNALLPALNWRANVVGSQHYRAAHYSKPLRRWFAVGDVENVRRSEDGGASWDATSMVETEGANENCCSIDGDNTGTIVVATKTRYAFTIEFAGGSVSRTKVDVYGSAITPAHACVVYDPYHSKWVWFIADGSIVAVKHSSDGLSWTLGAGPPASTWGGASTHAAPVLGCNRSNGRIVAIAKGSGTENGVATSDNGGASFTVRASVHDTAITRDTFARSLHYSEEDGLWILALGGVYDNVLSGKILVSSDGGVTWTQRWSSTNRTIWSVKTLGKRWYALAMSPTSQDLVFSDDAGVTWRFTGIRPAIESPIFCELAVGDGQLAIAGPSGRILTSFRVGTPDLGVFT